MKHRRKWQRKEKGRPSQTLYSVKDADLQLHPDDPHIMKIANIYKTITQRFYDACPGLTYFTSTKPVIEFSGKNLLLEHARGHYPLLMKHFIQPLTLLLMIIFTATIERPLP